MNQISPPSKPATYAETSAALEKLFKSGIPFQRGTNPETVAAVYLEALRGASAGAIEAGIGRFLRGEVDGVSFRFIPTPPELARIVRSAVVPERIPEPRRIAPKQETPGERARMRLKMPMFNHAFSTGQMDELAHAHRDGQGAMIVLALKWGIDVPQELLELDDEIAEQEWRQARNRALAEMERNPPPFLRALRERQRREQQIRQEDAA